ncbi:MAG TPA: redoxin domain-containing protein, partial [Pirellulales bacterium]|nr:redoxin domain-containing protein [Pirellulales bacterium]
CNGSTPSTSDEAEAKTKVREQDPPPKTADELLRRMVDAYHQAKSYEDRGRLRVRFERGQDHVDETLDFSVALVRPNKLRMHIYQAVVVCDGMDFHAALNEVPDQVLRVPAPEVLTLAAIHADPVLGAALAQLVGVSVPLAFLLEEAPLEQVLENAEAPQLVAARKIDGQSCYRVQIERPDGTLVFWIDEQTLVLRRVEFPTDEYRRMLEQSEGKASGVSLVADFEGARFDAAIDDVAFQFELPEGADPVERFDVVQLGSRIPKFELPALDGRTITRESLADKVAVIKFWQKDDLSYSFTDLPSFEQVYRQYRDQDSIVFLAVNADPESMPDDDLRSAFARADLSLPIARVSGQVAGRAFALEAVPTTVVIGRDGTLQEYVKGVYQEQRASLPKKLDKLLAGGDLASGAVEQATEALFSKAQIAPKSNPRRLKLKRLWSCTELQSPGNLLVLNDDSRSDQVFVLEGPQAVAEIDAAGKLSATHRLDLPERDDAVITFLRTATDTAGKRLFLGSAPSVRQAHVFDARWKRLLSCPQTDGHQGVSDALLTDLDGDGELDIALGFWGAEGVHCMTLKGERRWQNRAAENVLRLDVTGPDAKGRRQLLAATAHGTVLPIDAAGHEARPIALADRFVRLIFTADLDGDDQPEWCAIAQAKRDSGPP